MTPEDLKQVSEITQETGFIENQELKELRNDPYAWYEKATELAKEQSQQNDKLGRMLSLGVHIELARVFYEKTQDGVIYNDCLYDAADLAFEYRLDDFTTRLENLTR